jgi:hypothetical protein
MHQFADLPESAKSGRRMPAVKLLYQPSEGDTRPAYIMGHSVQVISVLVAAADSFFAVPLAVRIHDGVKLTNRDQKTLPEKCCDLLMALNLRQPGYLVADAYYARAGMAQRTIADGHHLISRVRHNAVAYRPIPTSNRPRRCGRPRVYGRKIKLWNLFKDGASGCQQSRQSCLRRDVRLRFLCRDLVWRPLRTTVRFVLVDHPSRDRLIFIATDLSMPLIDVIRLYGLCLKIELSFDQAFRVLSFPEG